jgi:PAS domain S-box-containing protein
MHCRYINGAPLQNSMIERILTLRRAVVLAVLISLLVPAIVISGVSWVRRYEADVRNDTLELTQQNAEVLSSIMQEPLRSANRQNANASLDAFMIRNEDIVRIEVQDKSLDVFAAKERPERRSGFTASTMMPVVYRGNTIGSVEIEVGSARLRKTMIAGLLENLLALAAQIALSIVLILILLEKRLIRPLRRLGMGAERLASRQLNVPFTWTHLDEIGLLGRRLEETRISLRRLFDELAQKNKALEQDIAKRKQIERELHEREARYRALVEQSPIAIIEWDIDYRIIEWNAAAEKIFGYTRKQALGQHAGFIVPDAQRADGIFRDAVAGSGSTRSIHQNLRADGQTITCQWSNAYIAEKPGRAGHLLSMAEDITEQRRAEEALSLSEAKFAGAFQCNPDSVSITRISDGRIIDVNQTFETISGFTRDESIGKTSLELGLWVHPEQRIALSEQLHVYRIVRDFSWTMRTRHGDLRTSQSHGTLFNVGQEQYVLTVTRDITDQRRIEEQKAEADRALLRLAQGTRDMAGESFFELLVADLASALRIDRALIGLRIANAPDRIQTLAVQVNGRKIDNFQYSAIGAPCENILAGEISIFATGVQSRFPDDRSLAEQHCESYAGAPLHDAAGNTIGVLAVTHSQPLANPDLVRSLLQVFSERASAELERKRADEALRSSEQRFATIFHSSPVAMAVFHLAGANVVVDLNNAFEHLFLFKRSAVIGKNDGDLALYANETERRAVNKAIRQKGYIDRYEAWINRGDGSKALFMLSGAMFELAGEKFAIFTGEDITEKYEIENEILELNSTLEERVIERTEELQQANQELESTLDTLNMAQEELVRSEKLAALGSLVAGIAHELNTPIGNSLMVASTLIDRTRALAGSYSGGLKRSTLKNYIDDAGKAGEILERNLYRAANLVASFKQVAVDQTSSQRRTFSLAEVVSEIMLTLSPTIRKTVFTVDQNIPEELVMDSYPGPLGQVVTNLVNNALLHGFEGRDTGIVSIDAQLVADDWLELTIQDNGIGIPAANINRVFDPFFTTKLGAGGSGLGLPIMHNIVTSVLGGKVRMQSEVNAGTIFILALPLIAPQIQSEEESPKYSASIKSFLG